MDDDPPRAGAGADDDRGDLLRGAVLGLIDRIDQVASILVRDGAPGAGPNSDTVPPGRTDIPGRLTVDLVIGEVVDLLTSLIGQLIAILESIEAALDAAMAERAHRTRAGDDSPPPTGFESITVQINPRREPAPHD
ncbi:hypothetical protein [Williamsia sterculiae]|uniref:Uncharacterized protein n=1 Tax=Williamsia sterculiae TaxID=1344003 RepID=A0A1N7H7T0_9NOCA|nr:hypothetical protein [Williamsia sterculiae]SIS20750.1 hypothetical protein SAMN05445060_3660 [Williamsia sterculiae]